jgi:hypothetical protein
VDRAAWRRRLEEARVAARRRGLWPGDSASFDRQLVRALGAIDGRGDAEVALRQLEALANSFRIDQAFIRRKLARLERAIVRARVSEAERQRLTSASQRILRLVLADKLVEASSQISRLLQRLR